VSGDERLRQAMEGLEDLGRWGRQIEQCRELRTATGINREQLAALLTGYFPQLRDLPQTPEVMTDLQGAWAEAAIQTVVGVGLLDPMPNHVQASRTVNRRLQRLSPALPACWASRRS
jgi:hypothetical protein